MEVETDPKTESQIQDEFRSKRRLFRLLVAGLLIFAFIYGRLAESTIDVFTLGAVVVLLTAAWSVFRCPSCRVFLKQTHWIPWRRTLYCPRCGVKLTG